MTKKFIIFLVCSNIAHTSFALPFKDTSSQNDYTTKSSSNPYFKNLTSEILYSYVTFDFNSDEGANFNRYQGQSNLYAVGADHIQPLPETIAGVYIMKSDTSVQSQFQADPIPLITSSQSISTNTVFAHARKSINTSWDIDISGAYSRNDISLKTSPPLSGGLKTLAFTKYSNDTYLAGITLFFKKRWDKLNMQAYAGSLYTQINSPNYTLFFKSVLSPQVVSPIITKTTFLLEGVEFNYKLTQYLYPFINAGLIQVPQFSNSRPFIVEPINGTVPQLNMTQNGYKIGGGFGLSYKKLVLRLEQRYYNASNIFTSNQSTLVMEYKLD